MIVCSIWADNWVIETDVKQGSMECLPYNRRIKELLWNIATILNSWQSRWWYGATNFDAKRIDSLAENQCSRCGCWK